MSAFVIVSKKTLVVTLVVRISFLFISASPVVTSCILPERTVSIFLASSLSLGLPKIFPSKEMTVSAPRMGLSGYFSATARALCFAFSTTSAAGVQELPLTSSASLTTTTKGMPICFRSSFLRGDFEASMSMGMSFLCYRQYPYSIHNLLVVFTLAFASGLTTAVFFYMIILY